MSISISIADDHKLFRDGIVALIEKIEGVKVVNEASNGKEILDLLERGNSDIVMLDVEMPDYDGLFALNSIMKKYPQMKVLMLSMHKDEFTIANFMRLGAKGYLIKECDAKELDCAIKSIYFTGYYFTDMVSTALLNALLRENIINPIYNNEAKLTNIEINVLRFICLELTTSEIANKLHRGIRTIEGYRRSLLQKTGARNAAGLVVFAIRNGYFSINESELNN